MPRELVSRSGRKKNQESSNKQAGEDKNDKFEIEASEEPEEKHTAKDDKKEEDRPVSLKSHAEQKREEKRKKAKEHYYSNREVILDRLHKKRDVEIESKLKSRLAAIEARKHKDELEATPAVPDDQTPDDEQRKKEHNNPDSDQHL